MDRQDGGARTKVVAVRSQLCDDGAGGAGGAGGSSGGARNPGGDEVR
jgi:hypothetical protein